MTRLGWRAPPVGDPAREKCLAAVDRCLTRAERHTQALRDAHAQLRRARGALLGLMLERAQGIAVDAVDGVIHRGTQDLGGMQHTQ